MKEPSLAQRFSNNIRRLLTSRKMSQSELSRAAGMTQSSVNRILTAKHDVSGRSLAAVAKAFEVDPVDLIKIGRKK